jgi:uncharacterized protein (TIGR03382 family)
MRVLLRVAFTLLMGIPLCLALALFLALGARRKVSPSPDEADHNSTASNYLGSRPAAA